MREKHREVPIKQGSGIKKPGRVMRQGLCATETRYVNEL